MLKGQTSARNLKPILRQMALDFEDYYSVLVFVDDANDVKIFALLCGCKKLTGLSGRQAIFDWDFFWLFYGAPHL